MKFEVGQIVKLVGFKRSYTVLVTGEGVESYTFSGIIQESEYDEKEYGGRLAPGFEDNDFFFQDFEVTE